jgi:glucan endo-1,3-alpha-glucosidase
MNAINVTHPEWVEIVSWNDFIEGTYVTRSTILARIPFANFLVQSGLPTQPGPLSYFHSHAGRAWELLPYFIPWYKTGSQPDLDKNAVWTYRT